MTEGNVHPYEGLLQQTASFSASSGLYMLFWMFLFGSIAGYFIEGLWSLVRWGKWAHHAGVVWGPFCTIYGLGVVAMYVAVQLLVPAQPLSRMKLCLARFIICAVAGTLVEYFVSLFQELGFGSVSWDYSHQKYNLGGRVSLGMTVVWGGVGLMFMEFVCPAMQTLISGIRGHIGCITTWTLIAFMCVNLAVSAAAVGRWHDRVRQIPPSTAFGAAIDRHFHDERMQDLFPNMQFTTTGSYSYEGHAA